MANQKQQFKVIIERDEDGFFVGSVPALPGCYTQAKTISELTLRLKEAIKLCQEVYKNDTKYRNRVKAFSYDPSFVGMELITL